MLAFLSWLFYLAVMPDRSVVLDYKAKIVSSHMSYALGLAEGRG